VGILNFFKGEPGQRAELSGGDGSTRETAVIVEAPTSMVGIPAEYRYIAQVCGTQGVDWERGTQALMEHEGRYYDSIQVKLKDGEERTFWFDITSFFGKL
jgi:hypothetical protein